MKHRGHPSFREYMGPDAVATHDEVLEIKNTRDEAVARRVELERFAEMPLMCECGCGRIEEPGESFGDDWFSDQPTLAPECRDRLMADAMENEEIF